MKYFIPLIALTTVLLVSCNNGSQIKADTTTHEMGGDAHGNHAEHIAESGEVKTIQASYTDLDKNAGSFVSAVVQDYLNLKEALVKANDGEASKYADALNTWIKDFDKSFFTIDQKKDFDKIENELRQASGAISGSTLAEQRKKFIKLSNGMDQLVKTFAAGQTLCLEYCPMYEGGAVWLSDAKEIVNPYYGDDMLNCGMVKEIIQ